MKILIVQNAELLKKELTDSGIGEEEAGGKLEECTAAVEELRRELESEGFMVNTACDGRLKGAEHDLVIAAGTGTGTALMAMLTDLRRQEPRALILAWGTADSAGSRAECMEAGADFCMSGPGSVRELLAFIRAAERRLDMAASEFRFGDIALSSDAQMIYCGGSSVHLTAKECGVMEALMKNGSSGLEKETILGMVWGYGQTVNINSVEVYVGFLRKKLKEAGSSIRIKGGRRKYWLELTAAQEVSG